MQHGSQNDSCNSIGDSTDHNDSKVIWNLEKPQASSHMRSTGIAPFTKNHQEMESSASILRVASNMGSPLMRLSGMELKYRLGHGD